MTARIIPPTMAAAWSAAALFGVDRVESGDFTSPVLVRGITPEEWDAAEPLLQEAGFRMVLVVEAG